MLLNDDDGKYLLKIARTAILKKIKNNEKIKVPEDCPEHLKEILGVFCTINENNELRGCIGYPEPVKPLVQALIDVAISAAIADPRFPSLKNEELEKINLEITVLTKPEIIKVNDNSEYLNNITLGVDGLIVKQGFNSGLLLPQVPIEHNMDKEEFLSHTCLKAGLYPDTWKRDSNIEIYKFQGQIFKE
ncbi:MAG: TIGR00296 family protein [Methanobacteriaceae archaeon]|nr:TIGR00296 family protein [Methanobacteriaceae archaeon]